MGTAFADLPSDDLDAPYAAPARKAFTENCPKCAGSGRFRGYTGHLLGDCFKCGGSGKLTFKASEEQRQHARDLAADRKAARGNEHQHAFEVAHPEQFHWMVTEAPRFEFAASMLEAVRLHGNLTDPQSAAVERCIQRSAEREESRAIKAQEQAAVLASAPTVDTGALFAAFLKASASGLKRPRLHFGDFTVTRAPDTGRNAGALYVKGDEVYLGKVFEGRFVRSGDCTAEIAAHVVALIEDPAAAVRAYGLRTGNCAICHRALTAAESVGRGIGPIRAEKFGF